eukprot:5176157-Amphidinium_carterae.1
MASAERVANCNKLALSELKPPHLCADSSGWSEGDLLLLSEPVLILWTEHSERHWLPSMSAQISATDAERDIAGRWNLGKMHFSGRPVGVKYAEHDPNSIVPVEGVVDAATMESAEAQHADARPADAAATAEAAAAGPAEIRDRAETPKES